jgi:linoleoyl-CoA desaturase
MKFSEKKPGPFFEALNEKVKTYFKNGRKSKYADVSIFIKGILVILLYISCYFLLVLGYSGSIWLSVLLLILMGFSGVMIVFNLVHDASHGTLFRSRRVNKAVTLLGDFVGINTYIWDIRHNIQHHTYTNILGGDIIIDNIPLLRLSPCQKHYSFHRYQVYYAPFMYMLYTLYWMFYIDFNLFSKKNIGNIRNIRHSGMEWFKLFFFKGFYIFYAVIAPVWLFGLSLTTVLAGFFIMHIAAGILLSTVALLGHFVEGPVFPEPEEGGVIQNSWMQHEFEATIDFSTGSRMMNWVTGGLNTHIAHHLYPKICHCHYYELSKIIMKHCEAHGVRYPRHGFLEAVASHFRYLKKLSKNEGENEYNAARAA